MAQNFDLIVKYTPAVPYSKDADMNKKGSFETDLRHVPLDYSANHIPYIKKERVDNSFQYDVQGVEIAKQYAYTVADFKPMTFQEGYFEVLIGAVTMDAYQPVEGTCDFYWK